MKNTRMIKVRNDMQHFMVHLIFFITHLKLLKFNGFCEDGASNNSYINCTIICNRKTTLLCLKDIIKDFTVILIFISLLL